MRTRGRRTLTTLLGLAALTLSAWPAQAFDIDFEADPSTANYMTLEKPTPARDFVGSVAIYLRIIPVKGNRVFPVFINTQNYLTCPDTETHWNLHDVKQAAYERRRGIKVLGFFFDKPTCDKPTFHMMPVVADS